MSDLENTREKINSGLAYEVQKLKETSQALWWADQHHKNSRNEAMDFTKVPFLVWLYQHIAKDERMVVEKSVQCGLSELFIINSHVESAAGLTVMYVLPKYELRNRFVNNRIYKLHRRVAHYSELLRQSSGKAIHRTSLMHFGSGTLAYVGSNVESEFIEMPVDSAYVDEKDRCNLGNLELLPDRYTASPYKFHREISNPTIEGFGIDERYQQSSKGEWHIKCPTCQQWFVPDFFKHVVREAAPRHFVPRDPEADPDPLVTGEVRLMHSCGNPVDRLQEGEYVHAHGNREWTGYRISKLFNKFTSLRGLYKKWVDAQGNDTKIQVFYNSDLGLPFTSKGAKITEGDLNACKRKYPRPTPDMATGNVRVCGVDVGAVLHYVVRDLVMERGMKVFRLLEAGAVPSFELLRTEVLEKWRPRMTVIDALPEIHKVIELKEAEKHLYSSMFQDGVRKIVVNKTDREVRMDRTAMLDYVKKLVTDQMLLLPDNAEFLMDGDYYSHMTASTRILEANDEKPEKSRFVWAHTRPDHIFLCEGYCFQAWMLLPNVDVFDFFRSQSANAADLQAKTGKLTDIDEEERAELERLSSLNPRQFLAGLQDKYADKK